MSSSAAYLLAGGLTIAALAFAAPASADPGMPDCGQLSFVCSLIPTMPDLDHDVDMTKMGPPGAVPAAPLPEDLPQADICTVACI